MANGNKQCDKCGKFYDPDPAKQPPVVPVPGASGLPGGNVGVDLCAPCEDETSLTQLREVAGKRYLQLHGRS